MRPDAYPFDLGDYHFAASTTKPDASIWFNRAMVWLYGFHHEESSYCFQEAVTADPEMAMGYWGLAFANGPFMNMPWHAFDEGELASAIPFCHAQIETAKALAAKGHTTMLEAALINALAHRFPSPEVAPLALLQSSDRAYADAMYDAYLAHGSDPDVATLYADALINLTPWHLWDVRTGAKNQEARTDDVINALETALGNGFEGHIGLLHYHIHALEMSPYPELALSSAHTLINRAPRDTGHLHHMPAHILFLTGDLGATMECSQRAVAADERYIAGGGNAPFYLTSMCHDFHMQIYAGMHAGHYASAQSAADRMSELLEAALPYDGKQHMVTTMEGYYSMRFHVPIRFGKWDEAIENPPPPDADVYPVSMAMYHYARAVAFSAQSRLDEARGAADEFYASVKKVHPDRFFFNNYATDILAVGEAMMRGEMLYREGAYDQAFAALSKAVELDDGLFYSEPWPWMHPPRHALGALLMEQGHIERARDIYRDDLGLSGRIPHCKAHRNNIWALHGLAECLGRLGDKEAPKIEALVAEQMRLSDQQIVASCCCRLEKFV